MPTHPDTVAVAVSACDAALDKKAHDPVILDVTDVLGIVELFVVVSATSDRQLKAITGSISDRLREEHDLKARHLEGTPASGWLVLDFGDIVCHAFTAENREFYGLESLWADVPRRDPVTGAVMSSQLSERAAEIRQA